MRAGRQRHWITLQVVTKTRDAYGGKGGTGWSDDFSTWASIEPLRGKEYFDSMQVKSDLTHRIEFRYRTLSDGTPVSAANRIKCTDKKTELIRYFEIASPPINPEERGIKLQLMCIEKLT